MNQQTSASLRQQTDYRFDVDFGPTIPKLRTDEPAPLGTGLGPSPIQLLCAAVGNCLSDSLLFALRKYRQSPEPLTCNVNAEMGRNPQGRVRVLKLRAELHLGSSASAIDHLDRALAQFQEFCTVTQSVGASIPIEIHVYDRFGASLMTSTSLAESPAAGKK